MSETAPLLDVRNLNVRYHGRAAVRGLDLVLEPGEIVGLVGESGCGKTSTALALMGLLPVEAESEGSVHWHGEPLPASEPGMRRFRGREMAMVFQDPVAALNPVRSVGAQMRSVFRRRLGLDRRASENLARDMLRRVGLDVDAASLRRFPHELSGGQCQRVMLAMAMGCDPRLLIADEPTSALDVATQSSLLAQIVALARERRTAVLLITHDLGVVARTCRRVLVMYAGRVVEDSPASQLFQAPLHPYSAGLLASVPRIRAPSRQYFETIAGMPPSGSLPPGCAFAPRCPKADARCRRSDPTLDQARRDDARAACFHPLGDEPNER